jgi:hypothetical protein
MQTLLLLAGGPFEVSADTSCGAVAALQDSSSSLAVI